MAATLLGLEDGEAGAALVCFTDIAGFARAAESLSLQAMAGLLRHVCGVIAGRVTAARGTVVKHIGDASLLVFSEDDVGRSVRGLLGAKREIEDYFQGNHPGLGITFSAHLGEIIVVRLEPIPALDVLGDTVNVASMLGRRAPRGAFVISREVYGRLDEETRGEFAPQTIPPVCLAGGPGLAGGGRT